MVTTGGKTKGSAPSPARQSHSQQNTWWPKTIAALSLSATCFIAIKALRPPDAPLNTFSGRWLKTSYTGIASIDAWFALLVSGFSFAVSGDSPASHLQMVCFLPLLTPAIVIWTLEAYRSGHHGTLISWPSVFGVAYQLLGIGLVAPVYYLLCVFTIRNDRLAGTIPSAVTLAITPATLLGYVLPTILMFLPVSRTEIQQNFVALWQPTPIICAVLTVAFSAIIRRATSGAAAPEPEKKASVTLSYPVYHLLFTTLALFHVTILTFIWCEPDLSINEMLADLPGPFSTWDLGDARSALFIFLRYDMLLYCAALLMYLIYTIWTLQGLGYATRRQAGIASLAVLAGQILVGPGATYAGVWYWREVLINGGSHE